MQPTIHHELMSRMNGSKIRNAPIFFSSCHSPQTWEKPKKEIEFPNVFEVDYGIKLLSVGTNTYLGKKENDLPQIGKERLQSKEEIISQALDTKHGRNALASAMVEPLRTSLEYHSFERKILPPNEYEKPKVYTNDLPQIGELLNIEVLKVSRSPYDALLKAGVTDTGNQNKSDYPASETYSKPDFGDNSPKANVIPNINSKIPLPTDLIERLSKVKNIHMLPTGPDLETKNLTNFGDNSPKIQNTVQKSIHKKNKSKPLTPVSSRRAIASEDR